MAHVSELGAKWRRASLLLKFIIVNVALFLTIRLLGIVAMIGGWDINLILDQLELPSSPWLLAHRPWTVFTYMFTQYDVFHILFNMLTLYWFGQMFLYRCTPRQFSALYVIGGLTGGALYFGAAQMFPAVAGFLLGSSAAVMAIVTASAVLMPDMEIGLLFIGRVKLKWIAVGAVILFALGLVGNNPGGHIAHFGGMIAGLVFGLLMNRGHDMTSSLNRLIDNVVNLLRLKPRIKKPKSRFGKKKPQPSAPQTDTDADNRARLDEILDKIKTSGYASLTPEEKRRLFEVSSKVK